MIIGMLISIFGVAFSASFNTPSLIASLANEHGMLPKWIGKKNKHDAPWVGIIFTAILSAALATQSYLFLVSCTVLASFVQYVPSILAVIKFKHSNEYPTHGFFSSWEIHHSNYCFNYFVLYGNQFYAKDITFRRSSCCTCCCMLFLY